MWDTFVAETAYHVLSVGGFDDRGIYSEFGQKMYQRYPCIGVNLNTSMKEPWVRISTIFKSSVFVCINLNTFR